MNKNSKKFEKQLIEARDILIKGIKKELLGPGSEFSIPDDENEVITDKPEIRYSMGVLFPQDIKYNAENDDTNTFDQSDDEENNEDENIYKFEEEDNENNEKEFISAISPADEESLDEEISLSTQNLPSSMGFTFFIEGNPDRIDFEVNFGMYRKTKPEDCVVPFKTDSLEYNLPIQVESYLEYDKNKKILKLKREMTRGDVFRILESGEIYDGELKDKMYILSNQCGRKGFKRIPYKKELFVKSSGNNLQEIIIDESPVKVTFYKRKINKKISSYTVMMINNNTGKYNGTNSVFQPVITIKSGLDNDFRFVEYNNMLNTFSNLDEEEKSLELLYRNKKVYGTGHGTSVSWEIDLEGKGKIFNDFFPLKEVPQIDFSLNKKLGVDSETLSMKYLSDLNDVPFNIKINKMKKLVDAYNNWIQDIKEKSQDINYMSLKYRDKAKEHIDKCRKSCLRMYRGLELLSDENNDYVRIAFMIANRAMYMQRIHLEYQKVDKYTNNIEFQDQMRNLNYYECEDKYTWRPFQLAFLLMSLESIIDENCSERDLVDLIWFPTGGGKTEAYLGLTAFTIFYRRLKYSKNSGGTSVIMRYTLRLLAAQQFVRAATLICACEFIRKQGKKRRGSRYPVYELGEETISIGLWIGGEHTPNKNLQANEHLNKLIDEKKGDLRYRKDRHNKFQILKCPWCGTKLVKDLDKSTGKEVGKWGYSMKNKRHFYLACTQEGCNFELELPIQVVDDELYQNPPTLLFGTVDKFAMLPWKKQSGRFFATDTKNRTPELIIQDELHLISGPLGTIAGLYETIIDNLCSSKGVRPKIIASTATIRRAKEQCSVLFNREVNQFPPPGIDSEDSFFAKESNLSDKFGRTYIGIMPSGKTKAMMEVRTIAAILSRTDMLNYPDEVKDKFWTLAIYFNSLKDLGKCSTMIDDDVKDFLKRISYRFGLGRGRMISYASELTSRVSTTKLNETLEKLERLEYSKQNIENKNYAINTLLATNMISVGVDVARLNLMVLVGQPKLTSEYIQASSRIGRSYPGIAFTLYDNTKSRDRSHYEQFRSYHQSFYKFVEPTGATPFSQPSRERALHAIVVSLLRHKYGLSEESDAGNFDKQYFADAIQETEDYIIERVKNIQDRIVNASSVDIEDIHKEIYQFIDDWEQRVKIAKNKKFYFGEKFFVHSPVGEEKRLMKVFGTGKEDPAKETLTSLRNVESDIAANILVWEDLDE